MQILILVHVEVVEGVLFRRVPIAEREVDGHAQLDLTASEDVLQEGVSLVENKVLEAARLILGSRIERELELAFAKLGNVAGEEAKVYVLATLLRLEEFKSYLAFGFLVLAHVHRLRPALLDPLDPQ